MSAVLLARSRVPVPAGFLVTEAARSLMKSGVRLAIEGTLGSLMLESAQLSLKAFILLFTWAETSAKRLSSPKEEAWDMVLLAVRESSEVDLRRYELRARKFASWGLLGKSPTVPVFTSGSGELPRRVRWVLLFERSCFEELSDVELVMLDRDGHWKLAARKLPERLDLLLGRPSLSASFAPS